MAKRDYNTWNQGKIDKFIKEGRGQGELKEYKPWITIQDFPSLGRASRIFGFKTQRIHHFQTDSESRCFYLFEFEDDVIDIREHFPLFDVQEIIKEKGDLNFDSFKDKNTGVNYVLSTTFLLTIKDKDNGKRYIARSIKGASELSKKISLEKLEIERRYWENKGIDWGIITQKEIPILKAKNIEWVHSSLYTYQDRGLSNDNLTYLCSSLIEEIKISEKVIREICSRIDQQFNLENGTGLFIFKYAIATKLLKVDMNKIINVNEPFNKIQI
ncbi:TnsA endonuclease C-terminal domain-containing protein [Candidatus Clostridium radicumherbarum]|uniref:TnsA endonuclease C-terminal domain-containing protein n=1 Tax=Candidatus Clostridium radicumherbarum TaxID=3381662 RepID=A0ABW8TXK2_9CLOT